MRSGSKIHSVDLLVYINKSKGIYNKPDSRGRTAVKTPNKDQNFYDYGEITFVTGECQRPIGRRRM